MSPIIQPVIGLQRKRRDTFRDQFNPHGGSQMEIFAQRPEKVHSTYIMYQARIVAVVT